MSGHRAALPAASNRPRAKLRAAAYKVLLKLRPFAEYTGHCCSDDRCDSITQGTKVSTLMLDKLPRASTSYPRTEATGTVNKHCNKSDRKDIVRGEKGCRHSGYQNRMDGSTV